MTHSKDGEPLCSVEEAEEMHAQDPSLVIVQADNGRFIGHVVGVTNTQPGTSRGEMQFLPIARLADQSGKNEREQETAGFRARTSDEKDTHETD